MAKMYYGNLTDLDQARYDAKVRIQAASLVIHPQFFEQEDTLADTHVAKFTIFTKLGSEPADRILTGSYDYSDPAHSSISTTQVTCTAYEYGNLLGYMRAPRQTSIINLDEATLKLISINLGESLDKAAAYRLYSAWSTPDETVGGPLTSSHVLDIARSLEDGNIPRREGNLYAAVISPFTKRDLFSENDSLKGFIPVAKYANPSLAFSYELGAWLGFRWVVGSTAYHATVDSQRHDYPIFFGANAFGQANGYNPYVVVNNPATGLRRLFEVGWAAQRGYSRIDTAASYQYDVIPGT